MKVKLLQWNIWYKENIDNILKVINEVKPDIVTLQEISFDNKDDSNLQKLKNNFKYGEFAQAQQFLYGRIQGNGIFSNYELISNKKIFVQNPSDSEDYSKEGRIYIEANIKVNEKELSVGTTHLSYTHEFKETDLKNKEIQNLINILKDKKENYIFSGDLNTTKTSSYIKQIQQYLINCDTDNTWTTKPFSYNGFNEDKLNWKLDYVFVTKDIKVSQIDVIDTEYSDHLPLLIEIEV